MAEIKLYKTPVKGLKIIGMCLPFVAIGLFMIAEGPTGSNNYILGWVCACFFGLGIPVGLFQIFDKRPQIIITENGIWDRTTNQGEIKWDQIIEAYPLDINEQKFISILTDNTFVFRKKPYKWATKINETIGTQNLNLNLSQLNIDSVKLTDFINRLSEETIAERRKLIEAFKVNNTNFSFKDFQKILVYVLISALLLLLSLSNDTAFVTIMIIMGASAFINRWRLGNPTVVKYAKLVTWFGFVNLVLCLCLIKICDKMTKEVAEQLAIEIEAFNTQHAKFPTDIKSISDKLELNFLERYFAEKIEYQTIDNGYELEAEMLFGKRKKYGQNNSDWE